MSPVGTRTPRGGHVKTAEDVPEIAGGRAIHAVGAIGSTPAIAPGFTGTAICPAAAAIAAGTNSRTARYPVEGALIAPASAVAAIAPAGRRSSGATLTRRGAITLALLPVITNSAVGSVNTVRFVEAIGSRTGRDSVVANIHITGAAGDISSSTRHGLPATGDKVRVDTRSGEYLTRVKE